MQAGDQVPKVLQAVVLQSLIEVPREPAPRHVVPVATWQANLTHLAPNWKNLPGDLKKILGWCSGIQKAGRESE